MTKYIDADALYEQIAKKEKLAQQRVLDTPSRMPNGDLNPSAIRYTAQLDERTQMKYMIADAPIVDAIPISFIEKKIESIRQYLEKHGGEIDIEEFVDGLISKAVAYEKLIEEWREENETD